MDRSLSRHELEELRALLVQERNHLLAEIRDLETTVDSGRQETSFDDIPGDRGDASVDLQEREIADAKLRIAREKLAEVGYALAKMDDGTYGLCEVCGRRIPLSRLRVVPETRYDAEHEAERERSSM